MVWALPRFVLGDMLPNWVPLARLPAETKVELLHRWRGVVLTFICKLDNSGTEMHYRLRGVKTPPVFNLAAALSPKRTGRRRILIIQPRRYCVVVSLPPGGQQ